ncbi:MAG: ABC transporter substrate-binding protein [Lactobacillus sp.]|jgi:ABC-type branched-subunit amino acid transport system substrate-binding protein|nr:ABC transporter substrate-binding protein [Lactobacillus sp.]
MKKITTILAIIFAITILIIEKNTVNKAVSTDSKPTIKIGVMLPLSGEQSKLGIAAKGAAEIASKHIKSMSTKYNYEFIYEDNQFNAAKVPAILSKFMSIDKIDALLDGGSAVGNISSPVAEKSKLIHLNIWASDANVAKGKYNFLNWTQPPKETKKMAEIIHNKGYKNVHMVITNHDGPIAVANALEQELNKLNVLNTTKKINMGTRDMRLDIKKMEADNADLYVLILFDPDLSIFIKQQKEIGSTTNITSIEAFSFLEDMSIIEGAWYVDVAESSNPVMDEIKNHNNSNFSYGMGNMYDNIMILVNAFENAETKENVVDELAKTTHHQGIVGSLTQDEEGIFQSEAIIKKVINGQPVIIDKI